MGFSVVVVFISWNMPLFKVWSEDKLNKKFVEIRRVYYVHSFVGAFESLLERSLNVGFLKRTFLLKLRTSVT